MGLAYPVLEDYKPFVRARGLHGLHGDADEREKDREGDRD